MWAMRTCFPFVAVAALVCTTGLTAQTQAGHAHGGTVAAPSPATRIAPMRAHTGPLPALPRVGFEPVRPMPVVQQVYEFAAKHPEILQYVPCYCGCERVGHGGNHDCFVKSRSTSGRVNEWDAHGLGCAVCLDVGRDAMMLFNSGASVTSIRSAIERKYASHFPSSTPTPKPPTTPGR
jgi:Protein of unknown function with PCYCGC motif